MNDHKKVRNLPAMQINLLRKTLKAEGVHLGTVFTTRYKNGNLRLKFFGSDKSPNAFNLFRKETFKIGGVASKVMNWQGIISFIATFDFTSNEQIDLSSLKEKVDELFEKHGKQDTSAYYEQLLNQSNDLTRLDLVAIGCLIAYDDEFWC